MQVHRYPPRSQLEIGYILAAVGAKLGLKMSHKSAEEKPRNSRRGYLLRFASASCIVPQGVFLRTWLSTISTVRLCLCGNIDLDSTLTLGTPEEVREEVKLRIRTIAPRGSYCCGFSNSVPEFVPFENYLAMIETAIEYGKYPIRV